MSATSSALRRIARFNMQRAGVTRINRKGPDGKSYFAKNWRLYCNSTSAAYIRKLKESERRRNARAKVDLQKVELHKVSSAIQKKVGLFMRFKKWLTRLYARLTGY
jgi:hypothetical protein